jgi:hypothetical protein
MSQPNLFDDPTKFPTITRLSPPSHGLCGVCEAPDVLLTYCDTELGLVCQPCASPVYLADFLLQRSGLLRPEQIG